MQLPYNINPYGKILKKYITQIIPDKYTVETDEAVDRIAHTIATKKDTEVIVKMFSDIYQSGYNKALASAQKAIEANGFKMKIMPPKD